MFRKYLTLGLTLLIFNLSLSAVAFGETKEEKEAKFVDKVKASVAKLGTGRDAKIEVKLKDGTNVKGYISQINENGFVVMNEKTATPVEVPYPNAKQVKGNNLSTGAKIAIGVGIVVVIIALLVFNASRTP